MARAGFETERFQLEQDVGRLQAEIVMSANEANAVKLEERTMNSCHLPQSVSSLMQHGGSAVSRCLNVRMHSDVQACSKSFLPK